VSERVLKILALVGLFVVSFIPGADAKSWDETIAQVEHRADQVWQRGKSLGADTFLGTAVNEIDIPKHECAILGRMLGVSSLILGLEYHPEPPLSEAPDQEELFDLMVYSHSLSNWALVARRSVTLSEPEKKHKWNLDCVGKQGIPSDAFFQIEDGRANFVVNGTDLIILGDIEAGFAEELATFLNSDKRISRVILGSGGGSVREAIKAGFLIRKLGLDTTLDSSCYSACPLVFLGGVNRTIWSPYPKLGFHQMSDGSGRAIMSSSPLYSAMEDYASIMGANSDFVLASMLRASPSEMFEPEFEKLCQNKVATWVQRLCFRE
jgi:hypothetical protein